VRRFEGGGRAQQVLGHFDRLLVLPFARQRLTVGRGERRRSGLTGAESTLG
jgi:hypothetical protein